MPLTLGTAGHVDHGKTALVAALTGVDTDRLAAERERGISIELGYAALKLGSGSRLSVIDVPGHERYVRTMVAGATGIDLFLMAIAADDGVMPQTREHAAILRALDIRRGVVALTKADVADVGAARAQAAELLPGIEAVAVSARTGDGLDDLRKALERVGAAAAGDRRRARHADGAPRLHVDRVFTIRGAGTVVTGTLWSGTILRGHELSLSPGERRVRVRGIEVHGTAVAQAAAGQRVAVNLAGISASEVARGDVLGSELTETYRVDAQLDVADDADGRVQVHHGTRETAARATWLGGRFWQLRLEQPLSADAGDRVVIRRIAPPDTLGGGVILDASPRRHGPSRATTEHLARLARGEPPADPAPAPPNAPPKASPAALAPLSASALATEERLRDGWLTPPGDAELDAGDLVALRAHGRAARLSPGLHFHVDALADARRRIVELAGGPGGAVTLAEVRDALGSSRRFAVALLAYLDSERVTIRRGDTHVVRGGR